MNTSLIAVATALITKFKADTTLKNMLASYTDSAGNLKDGIYDGVPNSAKYPYINIGDLIETPFNTFGRSGRRVTITLHVWSQYSGYKEALTIYGRINELVDGQEFTLNGHTFILSRFEQAEPMLDADGITRHIPIQYEVISQEG
jgi:hypothetical protein